MRSAWSQGSAFHGYAAERGNQRRGAVVFNVVQALDCLLTEDGSPAAPTELTVTRCIDCLIQSTYVVTVQGEIFHVSREADLFGADDQREVEVQSCTAIVEDATEVIRCLDPITLFECQDSFPDAG